MIGYVQSMELEDIFAEVNNEMRNLGIEPIRLSPEAWRANEVSRLEQN